MKILGIITALFTLTSLQIAQLEALKPYIKTADQAVEKINLSQINKKNICDEILKDLN